VRETRFTDGGVGWGDGRQDELKAVQNFHAPALVAQWIETNSDVCGRVGYRTTEAGLAVLAGSKTAPSPNGKACLEPPEPDQECFEVYSRCYRESIAWLSGQSAVSVDGRGAVGEIPLSAAVWGTEELLQREP
jgi:hypothetical protein